MDSKDYEESLTFFCIGDFGAPTMEVKAVAQAMNHYAETQKKPSFVLGLGDNFYPVGVSSVGDKQFNKSWSDIFLIYESLRVPWNIVLGNHDYMGIPEAQIAFTTSSKNPGQLWHLPREFYSFSCDIPGQMTVDFFAIDTNACQGHVQRSHPATIRLLREEKPWLSSALASSCADWKIVFGHHPMYTKGNGHQATALCLRENSYTCEKYNRRTGIVEHVQYDGFGMADVMVSGGADLYISGHEHVFQHHYSRGLQNIVCGNSGADIRHGLGFYGGCDNDIEIDWFDRTNTYGFCAVTVTSSVLTVSYVDSSGNIFETVNVTRNRK